MDRAKDLLVAMINFDEKDGSIHAYSDDIPGLHICGTDREDVLSDVIQGITFLYKEVHGMAVSVQWADSPADALNQRPQKQQNIERIVMKPAFAHA